MANKKMTCGIIITVLCLILAVLLLYRVMLCKETFSYEAAETAFFNPMMGFAPNADYVEAVGENTLVYVDVTWRELEPEEGVFDFAGINEENNLEEWRSQGKNVVFRFACDEPSDEEHMDIPDWLYEKTGDGTFYDMEYGKGYSPDYENETLIAYHKKAIEALGREYGQDGFFCYIELGSIGHWGEWHVKYNEGIKRIPPEAVCRQYVTPYLEAFPNAKLLMRRPFESVSLYGLGVYNDMTGEPESTREWLSWLADGSVYEEAREPLTLPACPDIWETSPVGGEFTSSLTMEEMLTGSLSQTLALLEQSHMTFIGPKCPIACGEQSAYPEETGAVIKQLGYRYGVTDAGLCYHRRSGKTEVTFSLKNYGTAPMYFDWPVCVYVLDENRRSVGRYETDLKLSELSSGKTAQCSVTVDIGDQKEPYVAVGIENPWTRDPAVYLDMETEREGFYYILNPQEGI